MRCRACGALVISATHKCPVCGTRFLANNEAIEGTAALEVRLRGEAKRRPIDQLRDYYMKAQKEGKPIHMSREDLLRLRQVQEDMKRNPKETMLKLAEGAYD